TGSNSYGRSIDTLGSCNRLVAAEFNATERTFEVGEGASCVGTLVVVVIGDVRLEIGLCTVAQATRSLAVNFHDDRVVVAESSFATTSIVVIRQMTSLEVSETAEGYFRSFSRSCCCQQCRAYEPSRTK